MRRRRTVAAALNPLASACFGLVTGEAVEVSGSLLSGTGGHRLVATEVRTVSR